MFKNICTVGEYKIKCSHFESVKSNLLIRECSFLRKYVAISLSGLKSDLFLNHDRYN